MANTMTTQDTSNKPATTGDTGAQRAAQEGPTLLPAVDVLEDDAGITVLADLPGVSRDKLTIDVDGDTLTLEALVDLGEARQFGNVYAEVRARRYRRSFALSRELDRDKIAASIKDGVLTLHLPKLEAARPRKVEVRAA